MSKHWLIFSILLVFISTACFALNEINPPLPNLPDEYDPPENATEIGVRPTNTPKPLPPTSIASLTEIPSLTPIPTDTPTPTDTLTLTPIPTDTPTSTPTNTETPTLTSTPTLTFTPSFTPTPPYTLRIDVSPMIETNQTEEIYTIISNRLAAIPSDISVLEDGQTISILTRGDAEIVTALVTRVGWIELIDLSNLSDSFLPPEGACLQTESLLRYYPNQVICPTIGVDTPLEHPLGYPYKNVVTSLNIAKADLELSLSVQQSWQLVITLDADTTQSFAEFTRQNRGKKIGFMVDGQLLEIVTIQGPITNGQIVLPFRLPLAPNLEAIFQTGPLPTGMDMTGIKSLGE